ncbi:hypothetical protein NDA18_006055 [Ustilago nuda]|nr:hypothetical protein NDA18_006055 [Ustilago nuda]
MLQAVKGGVDDAQYIRDADAEVDRLAEGPDTISVDDTGWVWNASSHLLCDDSSELRRGREGIGGIVAIQSQFIRKVHKHADDMLRVLHLYDYMRSQSAHSDCNPVKRTMVCYASSESWSYEQRIWIDCQIYDRCSSS